MKMRKVRFLLCLLLGLSLLAGLLTGCGKQEETTAADKDAQTAEEDHSLEDVQKAGKLIVGVEGTYPPFTYHDDAGDLVGFDIEVAKAVAEKLGVEAEFVESGWDSLLAGVDSGRLDTVINEVGISEEREEKYDFSDPYFYIQSQVVVKSDNDSIHSAEDLDGKKVATNVTNIHVPWYESKGAEVVSIDTSGEAADMLLSDRVDFISFNTVILADYLKEHPEAPMKVAFAVPDSEEKIAIPVRKGETALLDAINQALKELREDGTLAGISDSYFSHDYTKSAEEE